MVSGKPCPNPARPGSRACGVPAHIKQIEEEKLRHVRSRWNAPPNELARQHARRKAQARARLQALVDKHSVQSVKSQLSKFGQSTDVIPEWDLHRRLVDVMMEQEEAFDAFFGDERAQQRAGGARFEDDDDDEEDKEWQDARRLALGYRMMAMGDANLSNDRRRRAWEAAAARGLAAPRFGVGAMEAKEFLGRLAAQKEPQSRTGAGSSSSSSSWKGALGDGGGGGGATSDRPRLRRILRRKTIYPAARRTSTWPRRDTGARFERERYPLPRGRFPSEDDDDDTVVDSDSPRFEDDDEDTGDSDDSVVGIQFPRKDGKIQCPHCKEWVGGGGYWSQAEIDTIASMQTKLGNKWKEIAKQLPGRTNDDVSRYYYNQKRHKGGEFGAASSESSFARHLRSCQRDQPYRGRPSRAGGRPGARRRETAEQERQRAAEEMLAAEAAGAAAAARLFQSSESTESKMKWVKMALEIFLRMVVVPDKWASFDVKERDVTAKSMMALYVEEGKEVDLTKLNKVLQKTFNADLNNSGAWEVVERESTAAATASDVQHRSTK